MGRLWPGYLLDHWQAELAAHEQMDTQTALVSNDRAMQVTENMVTYGKTTTVASLLSKRSWTGDPSDKKLWDVTLHSFPYKLQSGQWF